MNHPTTNKEIHELIAGFLTDKLIDDELTRLNDWLDQDKSHLDEFNRVRSTWILAHHKPGKEIFNHHPGWPSLRQRFNQKAGMAGKKWLLQYLTPVRYAASLLIVFVLGAAISTFLWHRPGSGTMAVVSTHTTIKAPLGSKSNIVLPDGSSVWLNAGSTITYSSEFGMETRELQLSGEAFFAVKSDSINPFKVLAPGMTVRALGTRFNVKAYPDDNMATTTLEEGIVDVLIQTSQGKNVPQTVKLKPNEQLVVKKSLSGKDQTMAAQVVSAVQSAQDMQMPPAIEDITIYPNVKTELSTSWKDKQWIISDESLDLFVTDLERRYNLNIRFASNELKNYKFSGTIENETVEQILTALSIAAPVNYTFDKNNVLLTLNTKDKDKFNKVLRVK